MTSSLHIETLGHGPDLVMLHGWAMHGGIFAPLTERLAAHFRLHVVDLPGHGFSCGASIPLRLDDCARAIAAATPPALWLGWSLGGLIALHAAHTLPDAVRGLVAIASSPRFTRAPDWPHGVPADLFAQFAVGLRSDYPATFRRFLALEATGSDHAQAELRELKTHVFERGEPAIAALDAGLDLLIETDLRATLPPLLIPSLWIAGRRDRLTPAAAMHAAAELGGGRYLELSAGHAPFLTHGDEIAAAVLGFARQIP